MGKGVEIKRIFIPLKVLEGIGLGNFDLRESIFVDANIFENYCNFFIHYRKIYIYGIQ